MKSGIVAPHEIHGGGLAELYELRDLAEANWKGFRMKCVTEVCKEVELR